MRSTGSKRAAQELESALQSDEFRHYLLILFVSGTTPNSVKAIAEIRRLCREYPENRYELSIVDVYQEPGLARSEQIIAVPTLVRKQPLPVKRLVGSMADASSLLLPMHRIRAGKSGP